MTRRVLALLGAALLAFPAVAQAQRARDPLLGTWRAAGRSVAECVISTPSGTLRVLRNLHDEAYAVRVALSWRHVARPGCPAPDMPATQLTADGILEGAGESVTLRIAAPGGGDVGFWTYEMQPGRRTLRYVCADCGETSLRWDRVP